jgi:hypothetical protein
MSQQANLSNVSYDIPEEKPVKSELVEEERRELKKFRKEGFPQRNQNY